MSDINFYSLIARSGSKDGARATFEQMIAQIVRMVHPGARRIEAKPGDWGIDVFIGLLDDLVSVWQSKFFIDGVGETQQNEIRESFGSLMDKAHKQGFVVDVWTLCIPCSMGPEATKWWDGWKKRKEKDHGIKIILWDETELIGLLLTPEATAICQHYLRDSDSKEPRLPLPVLPLPDDVTYDDMLFVRQLLAAQIAELNAAKQQFFNHDLLAREVADKGVEEEIRSLQNCRAEVYSLWETRFNRSCQTSPPDDQLPGLHPDVMIAIEALHNARHPSALTMSLIHRLGSMHQVVEDKQAGWVRGFRDIARAYERRCG